MVKHTKEYAEKLAEKYAVDENSCYINDLNGFKNGYMKAIEETNVAGLLEALKLIAQMSDCGSHENAMLEMKKIAINAIKKAE